MGVSEETYLNVVRRDGLRNVVAEAIAIPCVVKNGNERIAISSTKRDAVEAVKDVGTCCDPSRRVQAVSSKCTGIACRLSISNTQEARESEHEEGTHL